MNFHQFRQIYGRAFAIALLVLYLPQTWVIWKAARWPTDQSLLWLALFPVLPGGYLAAVVRTVSWNLFQQHASDFVLLLVAAFFALVLIAILTVIGARGKGWQIAAILLGGGYSIVTAIGLHAASRM